MWHKGMLFDAHWCSQAGGVTVQRFRFCVCACSSCFGFPSAFLVSTKSLSICWAYSHSQERKNNRSVSGDGLSWCFPASYLLGWDPALPQPSLKISSDEQKIDYNRDYEGMCMRASIFVCQTWFPKNSLDILKLSMTVKTWETFIFHFKREEMLQRSHQTILFSA